MSARVTAIVNGDVACACALRRRTHVSLQQLSLYSYVCTPVVVVFILEQEVNTHTQLVNSMPLMTNRTHQFFVQPFSKKLITINFPNLMINVKVVNDKIKKFKFIVFFYYFSSVFFFLHFPLW